MDGSQKTELFTLTNIFALEILEDLCIGVSRRGKRNCTESQLPCCAGRLIATSEEEHVLRLFRGAVG